MSKMHGRPIWYELAGTSAQRKQTEDFYSQLLGWDVQDSGMEGFSYRLARSKGDMVAGMMDMPAEAGDMPPFWMTYFAVENADVAASAAAKAGASLHRPPADIPGTGRFAILVDPQGAAFGILQPEEMKDEPAGTAFDQDKPGHGHWHELMTTDPQAALTFYGDVLGWSKSIEVPMGSEGIYHLFSHDGQDIGGMQGMAHAPHPMWLPYFGVNSVRNAVDRISALDGTVIHGPQEVPGGGFIAIALDPQGAMFAIVGPESLTE
ncbi:VOC family protein [Paracoccus seriniphilus]|uniref:VOC family protein n=1 Tax=Paracoccus seriniphilus TaxID=184748 RepID=UPI00356671C6